MEEVLTDATMVRIAFKKMINYDHCDNVFAYYEEPPGGSFNVHSLGIWVETPPSTPPSTTTSVVKCYVDGADGALKLTQDGRVGSNRGWCAGGVLSGRIRGWIPPKFGKGYTVKLYRDDGTGLAKGAEIDTTDAMDWFWDYETGYLAIQDAHSYTIPFWIEAYRYVGNTLATSQTKLDGIADGAQVCNSTNVDAAGAVMNTDYNAHTILAATTDDTPAALTVAEQTVVGRVTGGNIDDLSAAQVRGIIGDPLAVANGGTNRTAGPVWPIILFAAGGRGTVTAGAGDASRLPEEAETATNKVNYTFLAFDPTTEEHAYWPLVVMPANWAAGTITATFYWTAASGSGGVVWGIKAVSLANDDAIDTAFGTEVTVADTLLAAGDMHITSATGAMTVGNSPAAGEPISFVVSRKVSDGSDTLAVDARLVAVKLAVTMTGYSE